MTDEKEKFNFREAYERMDVIKNRLAEIAQGLENDKEREDFTDAERESVKPFTVKWTSSK